MAESTITTPMGPAAAETTPVAETAPAAPAQTGAAASDQEPDYKALYERAEAELQQVKAESRKWEGRAKENREQADASKKTLEQQVADIRSQLEASNIANLRLKVAAEKGVDESFLIGTTEDELRSSADALIAWREQAAQKPTAPIIPADGKTPENIGEQSQLGKFAHSFFGGN